MKQFVIEQKATMLINQYRLYAADAGGGKQEQIGFAEQKRFSFKEKFEVFSDEQKSSVLFTVQARKALDFGSRYDIYDAKGKTIGVLGKAFKTSLLRSTWQIFAVGQEDQPIAIAQERHRGIAVFRRLWTLLPEVGDFPFFIRYHFDFIATGDQAVVGSFNKTTRLYDHYLLHAEDSLLQQTDWRTLIALGIMLDALQGR
ncbi:MAG TPA: hypothetical protein VG992_00160 [Candidatus Saccharimonadales bacterium]|nr:hypothetical protein [Candidatus Saccharimonadales bacterium]